MSVAHLTPIIDTAAISRATARSISSASATSEILALYHLQHVLLALQNDLPNAMEQVALVPLTDHATKERLLAQSNEVLEQDGGPA
jgi:hypothetical protein